MTRVLQAVIVACALLWPALASAQLKPGIPTPPWDYEATVESVFGNANYYTHWIDSSHPSCTNTSNPTGSPSTPRCGFPTLTNLAAGSVVHVCGSYTMGANLPVTGTGTAMAPIFFTGKQCSSRPTINLSGTRSLQVGGSYLYVEELTLTNQDEAVITQADHLVLRDMEIIGTGTTADGNGGVISLTTSSFIVEQRITIHDTGDWDAGTENDMHAFATGSNQHDIWIIDGICYRTGGDCIGNSHNANHTTYRIFVSGGEGYNARENCIDIKEVHDMVISGYVCHDIAPSGSSEGACFVMHYGPTGGEGPYNIWMLGNRCYDSQIGYVGSDNEADHYMVGNLFYNLGAAVSINNTSGGGYYWLHNTFVNSTMGQYYGVGVDGLTVCGNITSNVNPGSGGSHVRVDNSTTRSIMVANRELFWQGGSNLALRWATTTYTTLAAFQAASGKFANSISADPKFVNPASNWALQEDSPARGAGCDMTSVAALFTTRFGTSLLTDIAGTPRPNGVWDMGAFQFGGEDPSDVTPPVVTITSPTSAPTYGAAVASISIAGTCADDVAVMTVTWVNDRGGSGGATGTTSWSVSDIALQTGVNVLTVTCEDSSENTGTDALTVTYTPRVPGVNLGRILR